jgi:RNA polymerase sigma-70 factor (ECF subfamily)
MKVNNNNLKNLFIKSQAGDQNSYRELLTQLLPLIEFRVNRKVFEKKDCPDIIQEILLSIHKSLGSYDKRFDVKPWVVAICERRIVDYIRKVSRRNHNEILTIDGDVTSLGSTAKSLIETKVELDNLEVLMKDLPEESRQALLLTKLQGHSTKEAADIMGVQENALRTRISRSLSLLRDKVKNDENERGK